MPHRPDLYARWALDMRRAGFFPPGRRVGVAVSGGPDSVLLLGFMHELGRKTGVPVMAVHFNHHLRGAESDGDEVFVRDLARQLGIEFIRDEADTGGIAREKRRNLEATARDLRYRFFFSLVNRGRVGRVATAHTADDQAETVLLRLLRGAGTRGLGGIHPALGGKIVRPFLNVTRSEVEEEIARRKLSFRVDSSNRDTRFLRNRVRSELLPLITGHYNPRAVALLNQLAERARDDESFLEEAAAESAQPWLGREGNQERIPVRAFAGLPAAIQRRVLRQMIARTSGDAASGLGVTHTDIESLRRFAIEAQSGRRFSLPRRCSARRDFDWLVIEPEPVAGPSVGFSYTVTPPEMVPVPPLGLLFRFEISEFLDTPEPRKTYNRPEVGLDPDRMPASLILRNWRDGDRFEAARSRRPSKVKELFTRRKVSQRQRDLWPVLEGGGQILWVRGFPPAAAAAVSQESRRVLTIEELPLGVRKE